MKKLILNPIGEILSSEDGALLKLERQYLPALRGLDGFSHLHVVWWFSECDREESRGKLCEESPYRLSPARLGTFATRSPERPNPIALSVVRVCAIDYENGVIAADFIDAHDRSPLLDLKPYTPSLDRVEHPAVPAWCAHWPDSRERSAEFDWASEFRF